MVSRKKVIKIASDKDVRSHSKDALLSLSRATGSALRASRAERKRGAPLAKFAAVGIGAVIVAAALVYLKSQDRP